MAVAGKHRVMLKRRWSQLASLLLLNSSWGPEAKWFCTPVLNCHSCALAWFACPVGVFTQYAGLRVFPFLAVGMVLLVGALFGRLLCGWACPFGLVQDLLYKIPSRKIALPAWTSKLKYAVLALGVLALPWIFGGETLASFCRICPAAALEVSLPNMARSGFAMPSPGVLTRLGVLAVILALGVLASRSFCKTLCPLAAILGPLNYLSFWAIKPASGACLDCGKCDRACPTGIAPSQRILAGIEANREADCIVCHECQGECPVKKNETLQKT
jgi:polyferredoxin